MTTTEDYWHRHHIEAEGDYVADFCTCRTRPDGARYFTCKRKACEGEGQVCGGYCAPCFERLMSRPRMPEIVVLCGSTKFRTQFEAEQRRLGLEGKIVLTVSVFGHEEIYVCKHCRLSEAQGQHHRPEWEQSYHAFEPTFDFGTDKKPSPLKIELDELHKRKIDLADRVLVINPGGYIGTSTRSEIEYAEWFEKPIDYLEAPS